MAKEETVKASKMQDIAALEVSSPAPPTPEARPDLWRAGRLRAVRQWVRSGFLND